MPAVALKHGEESRAETAKAGILSSDYRQCQKDRRFYVKRPMVSKMGVAGEAMDRHCERQGGKRAVTIGPASMNIDGELSHVERLVRMWPANHSEGSLHTFHDPRGYHGPNSCCPHLRLLFLVVRISSRLTSEISVCVTLPT